MAYRTLELTLISAKDLKDVNLLGKMDVYAEVSTPAIPVHGNAPRSMSTVVRIRLGTRLCGLLYQLNPVHPARSMW
jgi:hypothetical protein